MQWGFGVFFVSIGGAGPDEIRARGFGFVERKAIPFFRSGRQMKLLLNSYAHGSDMTRVNARGLDRQV
jgi:hypothetical protein